MSSESRSEKPELGDQSGVTAVEMCMVLAIIGIAAAASLPFIGSAVNDQRSRGAAEQVVEALRVARQNAISTTSTYRVILTTSTIQVICTDGTPAGNACPVNRPPDSTQVVLNGATLAAVPTEMRFSPGGVATTGAGTVTVTYPSGATWQVVVNIPGRVRACSPTCS